MSSRNDRINALRDSLAALAQSHGMALEHQARRLADAALLEFVATFGEGQAVYIPKISGMLEREKREVGRNRR